MVDTYILTKKKHTYNTYIHGIAFADKKDNANSKRISQLPTVVAHHDHKDTVCMCKAVRVTLPNTILCTRQ